MTNSLLRFSRTPILCLIGCVAWTQAEAAPIAFNAEVVADAPLAYWRLGENPGETMAADDSGNGLNGTYSSTGVTLGQPGILGGDPAVLFDGLGPGAVVVPHDAQLNVTQVTMESVIRWDGPNGNQQRIIEKSTEPGSTRPVFSLQVIDDARVQVELGFLGIPGEVIELNSIGLIPIGQPTHLAATFDGSEIRLYINGLLDTSVGFSGSIRTDTARPLGIGNQAERERPFNGLIDDVVLYDYALSPDRVLVHWQAIPEPATAWLLAMAVPPLLLAGFSRRNLRRTSKPRRLP